MSARTILITGGAGFIGSHLCDELLAQGHAVRVLDNLHEQVHGDAFGPPAYLSRDVEFVYGDVCDPAAVAAACQGVDVVFHLAARVGVGQSMYEISGYTATNNVGTAVLLEHLTRRPVERLIVASSMSIYGEGLYRRADGVVRAAPLRRLDQLKQGMWEVCDRDGQPLQPIPTPESKTPGLASVYALSKYDQERLCVMVGAAYGIPTVALRFFNTYGPRQALSNPYTGVLAIFASRLLNDSPPLVYEDGRQKRDFVHVSDVARACRLAMDAPAAEGKVFNVGSGDAHTVYEIAERLASIMGKVHIRPEMTGKYRVGDIRHCFADISQARAGLGYAPQVTIEQGMVHLAEWLAGQSAVDKVTHANGELQTRGLTV